jgi:hypothetical protein
MSDRHCSVAVLEGRWGGEVCGESIPGDSTPIPWSSLSWSLVSRSRRPNRRARWRRYKAAAEAANEEYLAIVRNHTAEELLGEDAAEAAAEGPRGHVFDGADADALTHAAGEAAEARERAAERKERAYASASSAHSVEHLREAAAREKGSAAAEAAAVAADWHVGAFAQRDKTAADAAAEREARSGEEKWERGVERCDGPL